MGMIKLNMGGFDRVTRFILGGVIFAVGWFSGHWEMCIPSGIAAVTGLVGFCPAYALFGFDSLDEIPEAKAKPVARLEKQEVA